jgi:WD40 repeat protein
VLDAPELQDDFYLNLVDWSSQNVLSVGLGSCVYLWSAFTSQVTRLCDLSSDTNSITAVAWNQRVKIHPEILFEYRELIDFFALREIWLLSEQITDTFKFGTWQPTSKLTNCKVIQPASVPWRGTERCSHPAAETVSFCRET